MSTIYIKRSLFRRLCCSICYIYWLFEHAAYAGIYLRIFRTYCMLEQKFGFWDAKSHFLSQNPNCQNHIFGNLSRKMRFSFKEYMHRVLDKFMFRSLSDFSTACIKITHYMLHTYVYWGALKLTFEFLFKISEFKIWTIMCLILPVFIKSRIWNNKKCG